MRPRHVLKLSGHVMIALAAVSCQRTPTLEEMPAGTDVTIQMEDGRHVTGKLVNVDRETVVVSHDRTDGKISVTRASIADVQPREDASSKPALREVVVPAGAMLETRLETAVASDASSVEQPVQATLTEALVADGIIVAPAGSTLLGAVTAVRESGRVRGRAELALRFTRLRTDAVTYDIRTAPRRWIAEATKGEDAVKVGIGAAAGAVVGAIAGGAKGAAVGSAVGAGGGSAVVLATRGEEIRLGSGTRLQVELTESLSVLAPAEDE